MSALLVGIASAFWLDLLTAISPCPMATNIAAISFVTRRVSSPRQVFLAGLLYTVGRSITYLVLGVILVGSIMSAPQIAASLTKYMNTALGPILILVGMFLLELLTLPLSGRAASEGLQNRVERMGLLGALVLGIIFALSFCPLSAALFFGSLLALALTFESGILIPAVYGIGTAIPVLVFAALIAIGAKHLGHVFTKLTSFEKRARQITGVIFILVGIYYALVHIFGVTFF